MKVSDSETTLETEKTAGQCVSSSLPLSDENTAGSKGGTAGLRKNQSALVIGAGLGGLSAAIYLAQKGVTVTVLEQNSGPGGRMNVICEQGFTIDMGPTMLMMPEVIENIFQACGRDWRNYLSMQQLWPAYAIQWPDGVMLNMGLPVPQMVEQVRELAPEDADMVGAMFDAMRDKYENARYNFIEKPFNHLSDLLRPSTLRGIARALPMESVYQFVSRYMKSPRMREAFTFQTLYLGMSPYMCPAIYALLPYIEMQFGVWYPMGGTGRLAKALEQLLIELGGTIRYNTCVRQIVCTQNRATGVVTGEDEELRADAVICNRDAPSAYRDLMSQHNRKKYTNAKLEKYEYGCSGFLLYLGVKKIDTSWKHNMIVLTEDYASILADTCHNHRLPEKPALHVCIPTLTDRTLAPEGHDVVYILAPCANTRGSIDWVRESPAFRERILDTLEAAGLPELRSRIVFERMFTPPEFESIYGCYGGAAYGSLNPAFMQSAYFRPHIKSEEVESLYFAGAGTHPGGGVPIVLTSGRLAAEAVLNDISVR